MSAFKDNLEEQRQRHKYQKEHFWAIVFISSVIGITVLTFMGFSEVHWIAYFFYVPNFGATSTFYVVGIIAFIYYKWWWDGVPAYVMFFVKGLMGFFSKLRAIMDKISFLRGLTKAIEKTANYILPSNSLANRIIRGKKKSLEEFFYPKTKITDELPRVDKFSYFKTKGYHIGNLFDYDAQTLKKDENGTKRIIALFRDKKTELIKKKTASRDPKISKKAKEVLRRRNEKYHDVGVPTNEQELIYRDLFQVIEGILKSYDGETEKVMMADYDSPLKLDIKDGAVVGISVDSSIDVFKDGHVSFSLKMITLTVARLTILYMHFLKVHFKRQSRLSTGSLGKILGEEGGMKMFEDFFKIVMFRRILLNYGSVPSGWMCVRIESYDLRAIMSAVDRPLIPTITSINDGSNDSFNSDVVASAFLFTYWAFFKEEKMVEIMDDLNWCFNTTKDYNEIKAREASASFDGGEL